jgi:hypothetical protein
VKSFPPPSIAFQKSAKAAVKKGSSADFYRDFQIMYLDSTKNDKSGKSIESVPICCLS